MPLRPRRRRPASWLEARPLVACAEQLAASTDSGQCAALSRARPIAGDVELGRRLVERMQAFVFGRSKATPVGEVVGTLTNDRRRCRARDARARMPHVRLPASLWGGASGASTSRDRFHAQRHGQGGTHRRGRAPRARSRLRLSAIGRAPARARVERYTWEQLASSRARVREIVPIDHPSPEVCTAGARLRRDRRGDELRRRGGVAARRCRRRRRCGQGSNCRTRLAVRRADRDGRPPRVRGSVWRAATSACSARTNRARSSSAPCRNAESI